jgi:hypothetical protein
MVLSARVGRLEARRAPDVHAVHEPQLRKDVERAIHARQADAATTATEPGVDGLGAQAAVLAGEEADDLVPRAAGAMARSLQLATRVVGPGALIDGGHGAMVAVLRRERDSFSSENDFH